MKARHIRNLAIALAVLLVLWFVLGTTRRASNDTIHVFALSPLDRGKVTHVVIRRGDDSTTVARAGTGWTVNGWPASRDLSERLLFDLADTVSRGQLIAESSASHARLGVDAAAGREVTAYAGDSVLVRYVVGDRGARADRVYIRRPAEDEVYQIVSSLGDAADRRLVDWRDKRIVSIARDSVGAIEVQHDNGRYTVLRGENGWTVHGVPADSDAVELLLSRLSPLMAGGFPDRESDPTWFVNIARRLRVLNLRGEPLVELEMDRLLRDYLVRLAGGVVVYRVDRFSVEQLTPPDSVIRAR